MSQAPPSDQQAKTPSCPQGEPPLDRRGFLRTCGCFAAPILLGTIRLPGALGATQAGSGTQEEGRLYGMGVNIDQCIGCGRCATACKTENDVPDDPHFFNTWVERYMIFEDGEVEVDSPNGGIDGFPPLERGGRTELRSFFVPKLCNHCDKAPCVQVCPVGATFMTEDGVVLVDEDYCIGCRYCIQACPYGARWMHPEKHVASKCTFCFHRLQEGLLPACVEVCPTGARVFGDVDSRAGPLTRFRRLNDIQVLKSHLNTEPKVYYAHLDGEVR